MSSAQLSNKHIARRGDGLIIHPGDGIVPILKEVGEKNLRVIGTGFFITRYGLFLSAKHVLEEIADYKNKKIFPSFICQLVGKDFICLRPIRQITLHNFVDLGVGQADNFIEKFPNNPIMNLRGVLTTDVPSSGDRLITYAYPENSTLDFKDSCQIPIIKGDYFSGNFLKKVDKNHHPLIPYSHYETTIDIKSGASGGPVFDVYGRIIGVNCRGWDFRDSEYENNPLSSVIPINACLDIVLPIPQLPKLSWEYNQVPLIQRNSQLSISELTLLGHLEFKPPS